jgi:hypothetical protein
MPLGLPSGHSPVSEGHPPPFPTSLLHLDGRAHIIAQFHLSRTQNLREFGRHIGMLQCLLFRAAVLSGVLAGGITASVLVFSSSASRRPVLKIE